MLFIKENKKKINIFLNFPIKKNFLILTILAIVYYIIKIDLINNYL